MSSDTSELTTLCLRESILHLLGSRLARSSIPRSQDPPSLTLAMELLQYVLC